MIQAVYVAFLSSLIGLKHFKNVDISFGLVKQIADNINIDWLPNDKLEIIASFLLATCLFLAFSLIRKYLIIAILSYHGWLYEVRGKKLSLPTRIWGLLTKLVLKPNAKIYEMQPYLPYLPLPSLNDTITRYLRSMRPLMEDEAYEKLEADAIKFKSGEGFRLHLICILKWLVTPNYVSDWWEKFAYLKSRTPLACSSNIYGLDTDRKQNYTKYPASRAANCTYALLSFRESMEKGALKPITLQGNIPLCSYQYVRQFNTTRVPGEAMDKIVHLKHSNHVAVFSNGKWFKLAVYHNGKLLNAKEFEIQYEKILNDRSESIGCEKYLASLTASNRTVWANTRTKYFSEGVNKLALSTIEDAAFVLCFDDEDFESYNTPDDRKLDNYSKAALHGKAYDRWFDKSFNLIISKNARVGVNVEHTWADAPVTSHLWEHMLRDDHFVIGYDENGRSKGASCRFQNLPEPARLVWRFDAELESTVMSCYEQAVEMINNVDMHLYVHESFGKNEFKRCKTSPDAFVQMALQLAYYNEFGHHDLTYESSMTRLFRYGRTETIRSCSVESCNWVKSMKDPKATKEERLRLFKLACEFHQVQCRDAMLGKGVDRHLFCLYIIANFLKQDSAFLNQVLSHPWRLSTSQTAPTQANLVDLKKYPDFIPLGGGFGPVNDEGYGVSYVFCTEDKITFHICSKKSCVKTDSLRFGQQIKESLMAIKNLFD